jgi:hypothetical protein
MNPSRQVAALWQPIKKTGHVLVLLSVLTLLVLIAAGVSVLLPASSLFGNQMATTNGDIHIGSQAATNGQIHVGG